MVENVEEHISMIGSY